MAVLAEELVVLVVAAAIAGVLLWLARRTLLARFAELDEPVEPPAVARPLAAIAASQQRAADQERAVTGGLPDPAALIMAAEAAAVLGTPVQGKHLDDGPASRTMIWQPPNATRPMLRVEVRHARRGRPVPPGARPVPGVADGYVLGQGAMLTVPPVTAIISIHGTVLTGTVLTGAGLAGTGASLADLLPAAEARLRQLGGSPL
jgi:hypothetical protein